MNAKPIYGKNLPLVGYRVNQSFEDGGFVYRWSVFTTLNGDETFIGDGRVDGYPGYAKAQRQASELAFATDAALRKKEAA